MLICYCCFRFVILKLLLCPAGFEFWLRIIVVKYLFKVFGIYFLHK